MLGVSENNFGIGLLFFMVLTVMAVKFLSMLADFGVIESFVSWVAKTGKDQPKANKAPTSARYRTPHHEMVACSISNGYKVKKHSKGYQNSTRVSQPKKRCIKPVVVFESEPHFILNDTSKPKPKPELPEFISQVSYGLHGLGVSRTEAKKIASSTYCQKRHKNATDLLNDCLKKL